LKHFAEVQYKQDVATAERVRSDKVKPLLRDKAACAIATIVALEGRLSTQMQQTHGTVRTSARRIECSA
jgi:hypothetical protein